MVRLETRGAVGFTIFISSRSMLVPSKNRRVLARRLFSPAKRLLRRSYTEPAMAVKGRTFRITRRNSLPSNFNLGYAGVLGLEKWNVGVVEC